MSLNDFWQALLDFFFPRYCLVCRRELLSHEKHLCMHCHFEMPCTTHLSELGNEMEQLFWGKVPIERAAAYFYFTTKGKYRHLIHQLKFNGEKEAAYYLGHAFGEKMLETPNFPTFDYLIPIPLHKKRRKKRGYNQSQEIAAGIADALKSRVDVTSLVRIVNTASQTHKSITERWENMKNSFMLTPKAMELLKGKEVALIDDVVTTGATLQAAAIVLSQIEGIKISVFTLAMAKVD